jgi:Family of unknown function (DUF6232)/Sulfate permease family
MLAQTAPCSRSWDVTPASRTPHLGAILRLGARAVPLAEVVGFIGSADRETDKKPAVATLAVFGIATVFFLIGVLDLGWRTRFLAAALLFGFIALSAFHDLAWQTTSGIYRVEILTRSGETLRFSTIDPNDQDALLQALSRNLPAPAGAANENHAGSRPDSFSAT